MENEDNLTDLLNFAIKHGNISLTPEKTEAILHVASEQAFYQRIPVIIYLLAITVTGTVGNSLVLAVYGLCFPRNSTRVFVLSMAICDLITNVVGMPLQLVTVRYAYDTKDLWLCRSFFLFVTLPPQASGVMLVLVAFDRYRKICRPLAKQFTSQQAWILTLISVAGSTVVFGPFIRLYGIHRVPTGFIQKADVSMCWNETNHLDQPYRLVVIVVFMTELLLMGLIYLLIARTVWKHTKKRHIGNHFTSGNEGEVVTESSTTSRDDDLKPAVNRMAKQSSSTPAATVKANTIAELSWSSSSQKETKAPHTQHPGQNATSESEDTTNAVSASTASNNMQKSIKTRKITLQHFTEEKSQTARTRRFSSRATLPSITNLGSTRFSIKRVNSARGSAALPSFALQCPPLERVEGKEGQSEDTEGQGEGIKGQSKGAEGQSESNEGQSESSSAKEANSSSTSHDVKLVDERGRKIRSRTTFMMATLTVLYVLNWLPHGIMRFQYLPASNWCDKLINCNWEHNIKAILIRSFYMNSAVNAFVYSFCNARFRLQCRLLFHSILRRRAFTRHRSYP